MALSFLSVVQLEAAPTPGSFTCSAWCQKKTQPLLFLTCLGVSPHPRKHLGFRDRWTTKPPVRQQITEWTFQTLHQPTLKDIRLRVTFAVAVNDFNAVVLIPSQDGAKSPDCHNTDQTSAM
jgi:hypothetical protein